MRNLVTLVGSVLTPIAASAHPEHAGEVGLGLVHYVTEPFHIATGVLSMGAVLLIVVAWRAHRRRTVFAHRPR